MQHFEDRELLEATALMAAAVSRGQIAWEGAQFDFTRILGALAEFGGFHLSRRAAVGLAHAMLDSAADIDDFDDVVETLGMMYDDTADVVGVVKRPVTPDWLAEL